MRNALRGGILAACAGSLLLIGCAKKAEPEEIALEYGRAVYANDPDKIYRLISAQDRRVRDEETFRQQQRGLSGFTLEVVRQLASFITATPVEKTIAEKRATVRLNFRIPDANAPEVRSLVREWDVQRLNALSEAERAQITERLDQLHRTQKLPMLEGEETLELIKDNSGWRIFLNWAGGTRLHFSAKVREAVPLQVTVIPAQIMVTPGERVRVTVRAKNIGRHDVTTRVGHRIEPEAEANFLALLQCPLLLPVMLKPGEMKEFVSEYFLLKTLPDRVKNFEVNYEFPLAYAGGS
jgi:hypothetical protein